MFRGDDATNCCRPILLALTPEGRFYWRKFADRQEDNSWTATNVVDVDATLYTIYLGWHCRDTSSWATCTALGATPRLLSIDPKTGETLSSVELPALDKFLTGVPFLRNSLPDLKRGASPDVPAALTEPLWSRVYSLLATQQKKLVVTFSARWFRHDCYAGDCTGFGRIGISQDGVADWCNADGWMTNESDGVRVESFPGFGMLSLGAATNDYSSAVLGSGQDLRADDLPIGSGNAHFDLATNTWDRNLYMANYTGGIAVTIVNRTSQTIERIRFPCVDQSQCVPISTAESTDGGIVLLYERRTGADQPAVTLVVKGALTRS